MADNHTFKVGPKALTSQLLQTTNSLIEQPLSERTHLVLLVNVQILEIILTNQADNMIFGKYPK